MALTACAGQAPDGEAIGAAHLDTGTPEWSEGPQGADPSGFSDEPAESDAPEHPDFEGADSEPAETSDESEHSDLGPSERPAETPEQTSPPTPERAWPDGRRNGIGWPKPSDHSWDGSAVWPASTFPLSGMLDDRYSDGHLTWWGDPSPVLPPGKWDWNEDNADLSNWRNFAENIGHFQPLYDEQKRHFGWRLAAHNPIEVPYSGPSHYFEGSPGADVLNLGPQGRIHSFTVGHLGDGPDVLIFDRAWSLSFRTGGTGSHPARDNDLVVGGCTVAKTPNYQFQTASVHTGPGSDWIFARDMRAAAIDAGNGADGNTSVLDPGDSDDLVMLHGYMKDVRVFGGFGSDVVFWHLDEMVGEDISFFGPNFFGGGGAGEAIWGDIGTDRLVLVIPPNTEIVNKTPTPPGGLLVRIWEGDGAEIWWDEPMFGRPFEQYCITCGIGPGGRKTMNLEYLSADESVFTGWFWVTDFEELQLGVGADALVFRIDDVNGQLVPAPDLSPIAPPEYPFWYCSAAFHPDWPTAMSVDVLSVP